MYWSPALPMGWHWREGRVGNAKESGGSVHSVFFIEAFGYMSRSALFKM